jgi:hypothetical protein
MEIPDTFPLSAHDLITTSVVRGRTNGSTYVVVELDARIVKASYKVYATVADAMPTSAVHVSGELNERFHSGHSFVFAVQKKMLYFVVLTYSVRTDSWGQDDVHITWLMDPFKRRQLTREDIAPTNVNDSVRPQKKRNITKTDVATVAKPA